ncbi:MAG: peptide-methionine (R)-S-oxide reductase [Chromatiales bacterium 21-64-14]|nr:MAG: peptide-methionine (R)-S-oxide reductase [Chromatiales bacterium 21-64-14]HQU17186.1 peptide-methionine (R)-S-oxide reductase MsrB [Gammaproteobacteria bacterium]
MKRRGFIFGIAAASLAILWTGRARMPAFAAAGGPSLDEMRADWTALLAPGADVALSVAPIHKSTAQWKASLDDLAFRVLREEGTERPFSSPLNEEKRAGVYACAGCGLPLFTSAMKFDSGTGWPSFFTHIPSHLATTKDYKLILPRTEYHCVRCGGHQGHVFDDGPQPTGQRWCNNGAALRFIPKV